MKWLAVLSFPLLAACGAPFSTADHIASNKSAVVGGQTDDGDQGVVAIYIQMKDGEALCSGEIIAPTVVLTAAHCVAPSEIGRDAKFLVYPGTDIHDAKKADWLDVADTAYDTKFSGQQPEHGHDIGVVLLSKPTHIRPIPVNVDALAHQDIGQSIRIVGFGLDDPKHQGGAGVRRQTITTLSDYDETLLQIGDEKRDICNGDSGGPALMDFQGEERIVGISSFGPQSCNGSSYSTRVDAYGDFLHRFL
jgi:secreted trypsin-like serine protease